MKLKRNLEIGIMKTSSLLTILLATLVASTAWAGDLVNVSGASNIAIDGYDPVAFFTKHKPVHGDPGIKATYQGATYLFSSKRNRSRFEKDPARYAPQYGGFCAFGVSVNALFPVDIQTWQIRDGKLYLNLNPKILKSFNRDLQGHVKKANQQWPKLVAEHGE